MLICLSYFKYGREVKVSLVHIKSLGVKFIPLCVDGTYERAGNFLYSESFFENFFTFSAIDE